MRKVTLILVFAYLICFPIVQKKSYAAYDFLLMQGLDLLPVQGKGEVKQSETVRSVSQIKQNFYNLCRGGNFVGRIKITDYG